MERAEELKEGLRRWEEEIFRFACDLARRLAKEILERQVSEMMQEKDGSMEVVSFKEQCLNTIFGDVRVKRRLAEIMIAIMVFYPIGNDAR